MTNHLRNKLRVFLLILSLIPAEKVFSAQTKVTIDDIIYILNDDGTATVSGCSDNNEYVDIPLYVHYLNEKYRVERIADNAFSGKSNIKSVVIPSSVISVGESAFSKCNSLTNVEINEGVKSLGSYAFYNCEGLESIKLPNSIDSVGGSVFYDCVNLKTVELSKSMTYIGQNMFYKCKSLEECEIPESVSEIRNEAFMESGIRKINLGSNIKQLGRRAFYMSEIERVSIPNSIGRVSVGCFKYCPNLKYIECDANVIDFEAFYLNQAIDTFKIGRNVKLIEGGLSVYGEPFNSSQEIHNVLIEDLKSYCGITLKSFHNPVNIAKRFSVNGKVVLDLEIPEGVDSIKDRTFWGVTVLRSVRIPNSVKYIGKHALSYLSNVSDIDFGNGIEEIDEYGVAYNSKVTNIIFPNSLRIIGEKALAECKLESITFGTGLEKICKYAFDYGAVDKVIIPSLKDWCRVELETYPWHVADKRTSASTIVLEGVTNPEKIEIPTGIKRIGKYTFHNWPNLREIIVANDVEEIGAYAIGSPLLYNKNKLEKVVFGKNVSIVERLYLEHDIELYCHNAMPPTILASGRIHSSSSNSSTLHVPNGSLTEYLIDPKWSEFNTILDDIDLSEVEIIEKDYVANISINGSDIEFKGLNASDFVAVNSLNGIVLYSGDPKTITLVPGIYIVTINSTPHKVIIR